MTWKRSAILRKSVAAARGVPRAARRFLASEGAYVRRPPVLANSFPKSGTHLLLQVLEALPEVVAAGAFIASQPSITFRERTTRETLRRIGRLAPGDLVGAHLFHDARSAAALDDLHAVHYFIYRDPRDVVVSEAAYLTRMTRWHRLHRRFAALPNDEERIALAITGAMDGTAPVDYPDVAARFARYEGWLREPNVHAVRFEDLAGPDRDDCIRLLVERYSERSGFEEDVAKVAARAIAAIRPRASHTFRKGEPGGWRSVFTARHRALMKEVAGDLLVRLGYERDGDWA